MRFRGIVPPYGGQKAACGRPSTTHDEANPTRIKSIDPARGTDDTSPVTDEKEDVSMNTFATAVLRRVTTAF
jgi:hypothetical protein